MQLSTGTYWWCVITIVVMALSLGPSFAHLLEAPPRLTVWSPELWREATVFNAQFMWFAIMGGPLDVGAILAGAILVYLLRRERTPFRLAVAATVLFAVSLAVWLSVVAPVNAELATWKPGPVPENFEALRNRWETGHIVMTGIKLCGLVAAICVGLSAGRASVARRRERV